MLTKHTEGSWTVIDDSTSAYVQKAIISDDRVVICSVWKKKNDDEMEASAQLIATAPEMLAQLRRLEKVLRTCEYRFTLKILADECKALIKEATK